MSAEIANSLANIVCKKCGLEVISTCGENCPVPNAYTNAPAQTKRASTLGEQVKKAKAIWDSWPKEVQDSIRLEGSP